MLLFKISTAKLNLLLVLVLGLTLFTEAVIYQEFLNMEDLESMFGEDVCKEGSLAVRENGDPVIKSANYVSTAYPQLDTTKSKKNETASDKSPMSTLYELAEFNQIKVQFTLTDEKGPAHKKQFVVSLNLGEEQYIAEGSSIKKAQHEASKLALNSTLYGHPPKRIKNNIVFKDNKTPVQKLETWAKKHNDAKVVYSFFEQSQLMEKSMHNNYYHIGMYSRANNIHKVNVKIGNQAFSGEGSSLDIAKQNAARHALESLQSVDGFCMLTDKEKSFFSKVFDTNSDDESPISLVHEFGTISNMPVSFELYSEEGPAHIKKFVIRCNVGDSFETFGEGSSKKSAKKDSAENMIQELKRQTTFNRINCVETLRKSKSKKKKSRNLIKSVVKTYSEEEETNNAENFIPEELDPVSKLFQIQQAKHEVLPIFTVLEKTNKIFSIEVTVNDLNAIGSGPNKKTAKKKAAQAMLEKMGYSSTHKQKPSFSQKKKNEFSDEKGPSSNKNIAPGINFNSNKIHKIESIKDSAHHYRSESNDQNDKAYKLKDNLGNSNKSPSEDNLKKKDVKSESQRKSTLRHKSQLDNLSQQLGFKFQFSDFPIVDNGGFASLVSLTTDPPKVCYGVGVTSDLAQDKAALSALGTLKSQLDHISRILREENIESPMKTEITIIEEDSVVRLSAARETD